LAKHKAVESKIPLGEVLEPTWRKMLALARQQDVEQGGIYDARASAINLWAIPTDMPASWSVSDMTRGAWGPSEIVGTIYGRSTVDGKMVDVELDLDVDMAGKGEEGTWAIAKAVGLIEDAQKVIEPVKNDRIFCRFCDGWIPAVLLNTVIDHMREKHNLQVTTIMLAPQPFLVTNAGVIPL
tara:strand:- start:586 stop:1131 length:546 start_codon:yes stop_codon:yes gene_type:complete